MKIKGSGWFACPNDIFDEGDVYEQLVHAYLHRRAGPDGASWPAYSKIAKECGRMSRSQAKRAVRGLEKRGLVKRQERRDGKGQTSNVFVLISKPQVEETPGQEVTGGEAQDARAPGQDVTTPRAGGAREVHSLKSTQIEVHTTSAPNGQSRPAPVQFDGQAFHIPEPLLTNWRDAYPAVNVNREIRAAASWAVANPKNRKSNWHRFLVNWLSRAQDHARPAEPGELTAQERAAQIEEMIAQEWTPPGRDEPMTSELAEPHRQEIRKTLGLRN